MRVFWTAVLLLCQNIDTSKTDDITTPEDVADILNRTSDSYMPPVDFRCYGRPLYEFDNFEGDDYVIIGYTDEITDSATRTGCTSDDEIQILYPRLAGTDPMMPFYIKTLLKGFAATAEVNILRRDTPLLRTKEYCASWRLVAPAFLEYCERFHSDGDTCMKMVEFVKRCSIFRQIRELYTAKQLEKLCLDEDGCYNVMDFYDEDLPFCVKTTAINEFKNSSVGSWHNSVINYCRLTAMVPGIKETKYDMSILRQKGRTKEQLREMCLYLSYQYFIGCGGTKTFSLENIWGSRLRPTYRLLPEEGKEQAIPDTSDYEYETFDDEQTTPVYENGGSNSVLSVYWNIVYVATVIKGFF